MTSEGSSNKSKSDANTVAAAQIAPPSSGELGAQYQKGHGQEHVSSISSSSIPNNSSTATSSSVALVFDYDWSLINCNSDTYIFEQLWPDRANVVEELYRAQQEQEEQQQSWTHAVDAALQLMYDNNNDNKNNKNHDDHDDHDDHISCSLHEQILQCMATVPVQEGMLEAVRYAATKPEHVTCYIVSDANTVFIDAFLKHHSLTHVFPTERIVSNLGVWTMEGGEEERRRLSVRPYHDFTTLASHGCPNRCPPNMCKGRILTDELHILKKHNRIVYVGDGGGDYCPCVTALQHKRDIVLARANYALAKKYKAQPGVATLREWATGQDVLRLVQEYL